MWIKYNILRSILKYSYSTIGQINRFLEEQIKKLQAKVLQREQIQQILAEALIKNI